jgi:hypothetical protein
MYFVPHQKFKIRKNKLIPIRSQKVTDPTSFGTGKLGFKTFYRNKINLGNRYRYALRRSLYQPEPVPNQLSHVDLNQTLKINLKDKAPATGGSPSPLKPSYQARKKEGQKF